MRLKRLKLEILEIVETSLVPISRKEINSKLSEPIEHHRIVYRLRELKNEGKVVNIGRKWTSPPKQ